jgi:hypothetical protein
MISQNHMNRIIGYILALIVLGGAAYLVYSNAPRLPEPSAGTNTNVGTEMTVASEYAGSTSYHIEAHYPQFGIPPVDAKIKATVDSAIAEFKTIPPNPPGSSLPQNEFTGSFDAVYVGADVVSVELLFSEDTGGAHPNAVIVAVNVDRKTGKELTLNDALAMTGLTLQQVATQSLVQLNAKFNGTVPFPEGAQAKPENYSTFLVNKDNVTFIFNDYQVASHADGPQETSFPRK